MNTRNRLTATTKVGESKGNKRIWLESQRLSAIGFLPGEAFRTLFDVDSGVLILETHLFGERRVSSRKRKLKSGGIEVPVIDLCNADLTDFIGPHQRVQIDYFDGRIEVRIHHEDLAIMERESRFSRNIQKGSIKTGTIASGAGISTAAVHDGLMERGLESHCQWMVDVDPRYLEIADRNNHAVTPETHLYVGTVEEMQAGKMEKVDLVNVSLACDIHASCGKAKKGLKYAEEDSSITSVFGLISVIRSVNPSIVVSENVTEAMTSTTYMLIRAELRRLGYRISEAILDESHGACLETRRRYWMVAVSEGLPDVAFDDFPIPEKRFHCVGDVLETEDIPEFREYAYLDEKEKRDIAAGKGFRQNKVTAQSTVVGTLGKGYAKVRSTEPRLTGIDDKSRLFSVTESCRLRGIPEHLVADCGFTIGHEAAGQSILYNHGVGIGKLIADALTA